MLIARKFSTFQKVYRSDGVAGVLRVVKDKIWERDYPLLGKIVELGGNRVSLDGCEFDVSDPQISPRLKSRFLTHRYEPEIRHMVKHVIDRRLPLIELGGSIGVVSCISNRTLEHPEEHVVVEANPFLIPLLENNRARNGCKFTILQRAVGYATSPTMTFQRHPESTVSGMLAGEGGEGLPVQTVSLKEILRQFHYARACVICDIEGTEVDLIDHELETLVQAVQVFVVELHDFIVERRILNERIERLERAGFQRVERRGIVSAFVNRRAESSY